MVRFNDRGLVPAIVQDDSTGEVLTLAYMNAEALRRTLEGPDAWFYSRSRLELWHKGETSGNYLRVASVSADCDGDTLLVKVNPAGPACHTGERSCFMEAGAPRPAGDGDEVHDHGPGVLAELCEVIEARVRTPREGSYTNSLLAAGAERVAQKVVEEAGEVAIAAVTSPQDRLAPETADLLYHAMVLLKAAGVHANAVWRELRNRR